MAKEATIRKNAVKILEEEGWVTWCPAKVKYQETDIFGVFDCVCVKDSTLRYIQWTSKSNIRAREKKINTFFEENSVFIPCEVWGYDDVKKEFKIIYI